MVSSVNDNMSRWIPMLFCNSWVGRAPRFSRNHWKPEISKKSNTFTDIHKRKARFSHWNQSCSKPWNVWPWEGLYSKLRPSEEEKNRVLWRPDMRWNKEGGTIFQENSLLSFLSLKMKPNMRSRRKIEALWILKRKHIKHKESTDDWTKMEFETYQSWLWERGAWFQPTPTFLQVQTQVIGSKSERRAI